jgi:hypothetical protein
MKPFRCPHCQASLRALYDEIRKQAPSADTYFMMCFACGEPLALKKGGFRKLHDSEMEELLEQPAYQASRASWVEAQAAMQIETVQGMWLRYRAATMKHVDRPEVIAAARDLFISGFGMAFAYFKFIGQMGNASFIKRMELIEAELEGFSHEVADRVQHDKETKH